MKENKILTMVGSLRYLKEIVLKKSVILILISLGLYLPGFFSLPPLDRDEARFAQSSKQMVESGDYVDIRIQDVPRYKKPIGAYWLQALSVNTIGLKDRIWAYRIPSLIAAMLSVLALYLFGAGLIGSSGAFISALLLGASILLISEAHMAKTDALLLLSVVTAQCSLMRIYIKKDNYIFISILFWVSQGFGILIKGPIAPLISLLTIIALIIRDKFKHRNLSWLKIVRFPLGIAIILIMILPWFMVINLISSGSFIKESLGRDFFLKILSAQESHGFPPGYYLLLFPLSFFPGTIYLATRFKTILGNIDKDEVFFLLAWIVPPWVLFELTPTKLPHYVLPLYPAFALLIGLFSKSINLKRLFCFVGIIVLTIFITLELTLPKISKLWLSREIAGIVNSYRGDRFVSIASIGYHEPSLVFQLGKDTALLNVRHAKNFLSMNNESILIVDSFDAKKLLDYAAGKKIVIKKLGRVEGLNYSKGKWLEMEIYAASHVN